MSFIFTLLAGFPNLLLPTLLGWIVWLALLGLIVFLLISLEGNLSCLDGPFMGIVDRLIDPGSDYKFIHRCAPARRFGIAFAELPRRLFTRLFDDDLLRRSVDIGGRLARAFRRSAAGTLCRCVARRVGHVQFIHCAGIFIISYFIFGKRTSALSHTDLSTGASAAGQRAADDSIHLVLFIIGAFFSIPLNVPVAARLDFALSNAGVAALAFGGEMLIAGVIAQLAAAVFRPRGAIRNLCNPHPPNAVSKHVLYMPRAHSYSYCY